MAIRSYKTDLSSGMIGKVGLFFLQQFRRS